MSLYADNDGRYPEDAVVEVRYALTPEQERGDRAGWPWVEGTVLGQCGPDEWHVVVDGVDALGERNDAGEVLYPACFRDGTEIRTPEAAAPCSYCGSEQGVLVPDSSGRAGRKRPGRAAVTERCDAPRAWKYRHNRCKCPGCRAEHASRAAAERKARASRPIPEWMPHGKTSTYTNYRCSCEQCRAAIAQYHRDLRAAKSARLTGGQP